MENLTFENLLPRAQAVFYDVWIEEPTPEEIAWNKAFFEKYPHKFTKETWPEVVQAAALFKHARSLSSSWDYETAEVYRTPAEFLKAIEEQEKQCYI